MRGWYLKIGIKVYTIKIECTSNLGKADVTRDIICFVTWGISVQRAI